MEGQVITPQSDHRPEARARTSAITAASECNALGHDPDPMVFRRKRLIEPAGPPGPPILLGMARATPASSAAIRAEGRAVTPAPASGGVVNLTTDNPAVVHLPPTRSSTRATAPTALPSERAQTVTAFAQVDASAGGVTKSWFLSVAPNRTATSASVSLTRQAPGGTSSRAGRPELPAPANGSSSRSTSDFGASPPPIVRSSGSDGDIQRPRSRCRPKSVSITAQSIRCGRQR